MLFVLYWFDFIYMVNMEEEMNYIYDIVLNFTDYDNYLEFYEWDKSDSFTYIEKIPIYKINTLQMKDIMSYRIKINKDLLSKVFNKTITSNSKIEYSFLVTDMERVIALMFDEDGLLIKKSSLLIDEEDAVIEEVLDAYNDVVDYSVEGNSSKISFFTRREKEIKNFLINRINYLYDNGNYDEISYLYYEILDEDVSIDKKYKMLVNEIENNNKIMNLYNIVKLT